MESQKYDRFKDAPWFSTEKVPVLIGGAGGIGSWLTVLLTRAGFECHVYDFDDLEVLNMAGQLFNHADIGKPKVTALAGMVKAICDEELFIYNERVDENTMTNNIVLTAFDNIKARKDMFNSWCRDYSTDPNAIFIDGRLMAEQITIYCIRGNDAEAIAEYRNHLPDDSTIEDAPCTFKQVSHNAAMIAAQMVAFLTNHMTGVRSDDKSRAVPFKDEHMTALAWRRQTYRPATPAPAPVVTFEGQDNTNPSKEEIYPQAGQDFDDVDIDPEELTQEEAAEILGSIDSSISPTGTVIYGTAGEMEAGEDIVQIFTNTAPIPTPLRFQEGNSLGTIRELITQQNLATFPDWISVGEVPAPRIAELVGNHLMFSEREWLRASPDVTFCVSTHTDVHGLVPFSGIDHLMRYIPQIRNVGNDYEMDHQAFNEMIYAINNTIPENFDEARRLAQTRRITLVNELPF